jgi:exodeoxyribonuclease V alpha subunit
VVLCDEYAMVSTGLHRDLIEALGTGNIRMFGDIRQLPPIENGDLADPTSPFERCLAKSNSFFLEQVYRQEEGNGIIEAARAINRGHMFAQNPDVKIIVNVSMVAKLYDEVRVNPETWRSIEHQIISPARKSDVGTVKLNGVLQSMLNPAMRDAISLPRQRWDKTRISVALDDKVVCTVNTYDLRGFNERFETWVDDITPVWDSFIPCPANKQMLNGEVGRIVAIGLDGTLEIDFGDRLVEVPPEITEYSRRQNMLFAADHRKNLELAYALTTHKCQGSEYKSVAYVMAPAAFFNLSRQNFYTGITRARNNVLIFCDQRSLSASLSNVSKRKFPKKA